MVRRAAPPPPASGSAADKFRSRGGWNLSNMNRRQGTHDSYQDNFEHEEDEPVSPGTIDTPSTGYFPDRPSVPPKDGPHFEFRQKGQFERRPQPRAPPPGAAPAVPASIPKNRAMPEIAPWEMDDGTALPPMPSDNSFPRMGPGPDYLGGGLTGPSRARTEAPGHSDQSWFGESQLSPASANSDQSAEKQPKKGLKGRRFGGLLDSESRGSSGRNSPSMTSLRNRTNSNLAPDNAGGSSSSRPITPSASDVAPWEYQNFQDVSQYGSALPHNPPTSAPTPDRRLPRAETTAHPSGSGGHGHRFHFPGQKGHRGKGENGKAPSGDDYQSSRLEPISHPSPRRMTEMPTPPHSATSSRSNVHLRPDSPMGFDHSPSDSSHTKRSFLDKIRRPKGEKHGDGPKGLSLAQRSFTELRDPRKRERDASIATTDSGSTIKHVATDASEQSARKESKARILYNHARTRRALGQGGSRDEDKTPTERENNESYWALDTNLSDMDGIITSPPVDQNGGIFTGLTPTEDTEELWEAEPAAGTAGWIAPDSWAVRNVGDDNMARLQEINDDGTLPTDLDGGAPHGIRVFRIDSTFATLSVSVNATAADILQVLGKKSFLQDDLDTYQIIMKKHDLQKQLRPGERPAAIQKQLLELAGYTDKDHIEEIGREDNSYLCKFTFVPMKLSGYYTMEKDPGLSKLSRFRDIDLSGRNMVAIPIVLYSHSTDIVTLNLSRNLALDVPKDFIQSCQHLRTIIFTGNEAIQLPPSFGLATRLTLLDISHNRLTELNHARLDNLTSLMSIKLSNNRLTALPPSFAKFKSLRKLNLSSNYLTKFPTLLYELEALVDLDISFNHIEEVPHIGRLKNLERFIATNNRIGGAFPNAFEKLQNLRELDVRHNGITNMDVVARLPSLEQLAIGNNSISKFEGSFQNLRVLSAERNPITRFHIDAPIPTLVLLDISDAKIVSVDDSLFEKIPNLTKLVLDKNQFRTLPEQLGLLRRLNYLSISKNALGALPSSIGALQELEVLDAHECNLRTLPAEIWFCANLKTLNVAANVLESFPKLTPSLQVPMMHSPSMQSLNSSINGTAPHSPAPEESDGYLGRRPSQASTGLLSVHSSPANSTRKGSLASVYGGNGRKASVVSRTPTNDGFTPITRKDSNLTSKLNTTFANSLRNLSLTDNRLGEDVFEAITHMSQLRTLNLSYNELDDIPQNVLRKWPNLQELYLSGNELRSIPSDDLLKMESNSIRVLYLNSNKFQVLPAELGKMAKLAVLDVGSNSLKYNVTNWRYDWNWNWNPNLKYLNFSGNKRLEIKPNATSMAGSQNEMQDLTNFNRMTSMRVLGLMDVTLMIPSIPDQTADRRIRSSDTTVGSMNYGMADTLGRGDHLSIIDLLVGSFRGNESETLLGMFDGQAMPNGGSKVAKFLAENMGVYLSDELGRLKSDEDASDALRRTFLALNKDLASTAAIAWDEKEAKLPQLVHRGSTTGQTLTQDDVRSGGVATILFLDNMDLFVANVGDAQAVLMQSDGNYKVLTEKHHPAQKQERERIREAGGYVSRFGKLNDSLDVSRAFGYVHLMPAVMACPSVNRITLTEQDELIVVASRELWEYVSPDVAVDVARSERTDVMRAAEKLRDLAISFGASSKIMVMVLGVADLKRREKHRNRGATLSMGPSQFPEDLPYPTKRRRGVRGHEPDDSKLGRLDKEVDAPQGEMSLVFTDIKSSTALWELNPVAMQAGIKIHNDLLRRQLRIIGGYEVKTEGDAFMVAFPTATAALLWCFSVQSALLTAPWPTEILEGSYGREVLDDDENTIYRGLSVRMGTHWGSPVCEPDPITRRMDYFGPMVNRASRISSVADGGQITVSTDFLSEISRTLSTYQELDRNGSAGSEETMMDDTLAMSIRRDLRMLVSQGFEVKHLGERKLKGLENPEYIYMMYPHALAGRLTVAMGDVNKGSEANVGPAVAELPGDAEAGAVINPAGLGPDSQLFVTPELVWSLWKVSLRLEMLCSTLETPGEREMHAPETLILERIKERAGEISDSAAVQFMEHLVVRLESAILSLELRNMVRPFGSTTSLLDQAGPMADVLHELASQLSELRVLKAQLGAA